MQKTEAVKLSMASSCHEVQGEMEHGKFEFVPGLFGDKVTSSLNNELSQVLRTCFHLKTVL